MNKKKHSNRYLLGVLSLAFLCYNCADKPNKTIQKSRILEDLSEMSENYSEIFQLSDPDRPGSWCWFQDERVIMDTNSPNAPILMTGVVTYGDSLSDDKFIRTKISKNPHDPTLWNETILSDAPQAGITYTNPIYLSEGNNGKGQIFNGIRSRGFDSNFIYSNDLGENWIYGGQTLNAKDAWPEHPDGGRAYVKYAGDGTSKIHLFATDDHPRVNFSKDRSKPGPYLNSIYHAYIENGKLHKTDGTVIDENLYDENAVPPTEMTVLLKDSTVIDGMAMRRGWVNDIKITPDHQPFGVIQFRANDNQEDHRYFYVRYDGKKWHVNFMAYAGDNFGPTNEGDYTGLASVDASNPDVVFISTSANPITGTPLISSVSGKQQQEIYMGKTKDFGKIWDWVALTKNSDTDNLRPIVPKWDKGKSIVLWMKGNYPKFYVYDTKILGQIIHH